MRKIFNSSDRKHSALHSLIWMCSKPSHGRCPLSLTGVASSAVSRWTASQATLGEGLSHSDTLWRWPSLREVVDDPQLRPGSAGATEFLQVQESGERAPQQESHRTMRRLKLLFTHLYEQLSAQRSASRQSIVQYDTLTTEDVFGLERSDSTVAAEMAKQQEASPVTATSAAAAATTAAPSARMEAASGRSLPSVPASPGAEGSFVFSNSDGESSESSVDDAADRDLDNEDDKSSGSTSSSTAYAASLGGAGHGASATGIIGYNRKRRDHADDDDDDQEAITLAVLAARKPTPQGTVAVVRATVCPLLQSPFPAISQVTPWTRLRHQQPQPQPGLHPRALRRGRCGGTGRSPSCWDARPLCWIGCWAAVLRARCMWGA